MRRVIIVGCGNMGRAMLDGWIGAGVGKLAEIGVVEPNEMLRSYADQIGVWSATDPLGLSDNSEYIFILAVKPTILHEVLSQYRRFSKRSVFVSIAAGVTVTQIEGALAGANVIRAMPNLPVSVAQGSTVMFVGETVSSTSAEFVQELFSLIGGVHIFHEEKMIDVATAISGSGPAYIFYFLECWAKTASKLGLNEAVGARLVLETGFGALMLAVKSNLGVGDLRRQVTSPGGTTEAAISVLEEGLESLMQRAAEAASQRAKELMNS
jgi:pyrroline-5-carboxylate reductase